MQYPKGSGEKEKKDRKNASQKTLIYISSGKKKEYILVGHPGPEVRLKNALAFQDQTANPHSGGLMDRQLSHTALLADRHLSYTALLAGALHRPG